MGIRPSSLLIHDTFSGNEFEDILEEKNVVRINTVTEYVPNEDSYNINEKCLSKIGDIWISYIILNKGSEVYLVNELIFYYSNKDSRPEIDELFITLSECIVDYDNDNFDKINILSVNNNILELEPISYDSKVDIDIMYNSDTIKSINKLIKKIKINKSGLSIFHGERGLGKTNMCKYLSSKIDRISVFIPTNMIDMSINNPEFKNFIKKYDKCLLIIDDCEFLYNPVYGKVNYFTNSILQLVDGFISEHIDLQILLIFNNDEIDEIDENLLGSNNLLGSIEFDYLEGDSATILSKNIGNNRKYKDSTKLNDVFKNKKNDKKIEFGLK